MQTLNINLPDDVHLSEKEVLGAAAISLYDKGVLNLHQAAAMAGYTVPDFIEELTAQSFPAFHYR